MLFWSLVSKDAIGIEIRYVYSSVKKDVIVTGNVVDQGCKGKYIEK